MSHLEANGNGGFPMDRGVEIVALSSHGGVSGLNPDGTPMNENPALPPPLPSSVLPSGGAPNGSSRQNSTPAQSQQSQVENEANQATDEEIPSTTPPPSSSTTESRGAPEEERV